MKIDKKLRERCELQKEVVALIESIKLGTKDRGLLLLDDYFAHHLGVTTATIWNMRKGDIKARKLQLKNRLKVLKKLYQECVINKNII